MSQKQLQQLMRSANAVLKEPQPIDPRVPIRVGVDLGTAFTVIFVTDAEGRPLAAANAFADVVRDGIVWDFAGAQQVVRSLKEQLEQATGRTLLRGAATVPPSVNTADHRAHRYVLEGAGIDCDGIVEETVAANAILGIRDGAIVDIGGGSTGVAIIRDGVVVENHDEPTGGTHLSLVIAGALGISFDEAERLKRKKSEQARLRTVVRPTLERMATIVAKVVEGKHVSTVHLVGGTAAFAGSDEIMSQVIGLPCRIAPQPMLVTPLGVAQWSETMTEGDR